MVITVAHHDVVTWALLQHIRKVFRTHNAIGIGVDILIAYDSRCGAARDFSFLAGVDDRG